MHTVIPQPGHMVVEPMESEELNKTKLATVEDNKQPAIGKVLSVSEYAGVYENYSGPVSTDVKKGNIIAYIKYSEHRITVDGKDVLLVPFNRVVAVIKERK